MIICQKLRLYKLQDTNYQISQEELIISLIELLPKITSEHNPNSEIYKYISCVSKNAVEYLFGPGNLEKINMGPLGVIDIPFFSMGAINTTHLFGLDELILFSFYLKNKLNYKKVGDLGANVGVHSIILSNLGFDVTSYEPDSIHFQKIKENININCLNNKPHIVNKAISNKSGYVEFLRVKGNTTGSHIKGSKKDPYGEIETIKVQTDSFKEILKDLDFLKIDIEGHEAEVLRSTSKEDWLNTDAMVEVGSESNAKIIFEFFNSIEINLFSQKTGWNLVQNTQNMPTSYKDGSLFITNKSYIPW